LPKRDPYTYTKPNSNANGIAKHNADTYGDSKFYSDRNTKRYTKANSNAQDSSDTKTAPYTSGLKVQSRSRILTYGYETYPPETAFAYLEP